MGKKLLYEKHAVNYGSVIGLDVGSCQKKGGKRTQCKFGATRHLISWSKYVPFNKANVQTKKSFVDSKKAIDKTNKATGNKNLAPQL